MRALCAKAPPPGQKGNLQRRRRQGQRRSARWRYLRLEEERKRDRVVPGRTLAPRRSPTGRSTGRSRGSRRGSLQTDRKSTRLNSSHITISYAVFCLKKKKKKKNNNNELHKKHIRLKTLEDT